MSDPSFNETDALSALSALASQAPFQPTSDYPYLANETEQADGAGPSNDESSMLVDQDPTHQWHASDAQALAQALAQQAGVINGSSRGEVPIENADEMVDMIEDGSDVKLEFRAPQSSGNDNLLDPTADVVSAIEAVTRAAQANAFPVPPPASSAPAKAAKKPRITRSVNPFATRWLTENYEASPDTSLQRASMYASYSSLCDAHDVKPVSTASFGKAVRAAFPGLKTRRLGTRKNSKYCYTGLQAFTPAELERLQQFDTFFAEGGEVPAVWQTERKPTRKPWEEEDDEEDWNGLDDDDEMAEGDDEEEEDDPADLIIRVPSDRPPKERAKRKPRQKTRPKTVHIVEQEVDGQWVQHVEVDGVLFPCDSKGEPLPPTGTDAHEDEMISTDPAPESANAEASTSALPFTDGVPSPSAPASKRPKRARASLGRSVVASMLDEDSEEDELDTSTSARRGKKRAGPGDDRDWSQGPKAGKKGKPGPKSRDRAGVLAHVTPEEKKSFIELAEGLDKLRDTVPALRALFVTSTARTAALDRPDPSTGLIDGLTPLSTPADGKIVILNAAKTYIQHLDEERKKTDRQRLSLEEFILRTETGEEALKSWRESFAKEDELFLKQQERLAALPPLPDALAGLSGLLDNEGNPIHPAPAQDGQPPVDSKDMAAFALAALAPALNRSGSVGSDAAGSPAPKKTTRNDDAREKNRMKQRLYRERQKAKLKQLESQIERMESGETAVLQPSTAGPTKQQEHLRALRQEQEQLKGEEQRAEDATGEDSQERNRLMVLDHIERATQQAANGQTEAEQAQQEGRQQ